MPTRTPLDRVRTFAGFLCIFLAWLFPYCGGGSPDAMQQLYMLAVLSVAAILFGLSSVSPWIFVMLAGGALTMMLTPNPYWGRQVAGVSGLLMLGLACHVGRHLRSSPDGLVALLYALVAAAFINAVEGLLQWSDLLGELYRWVVAPEQRGIAYGAFRQRNLFATFLCIGSICTVWLVQLRRLSESMAWFLVSVLMLGIAASGSRTGVVEVLALALLAIFMRKRHAVSVARLLVGQVGILAIAMVLLPLIANALGFEFVAGATRAVQTGQSARLAIWNNAIELIAQRPWSGWGWREFGFGHYVTLFEHRYNELLDNAHNLPLQLAVEFGLPFSILIFGVLARATYQAFPWRNQATNVDGVIGSASDSMFAWAVLIVIVGIHSMLEYPLWYAGFLFLTGIMLGYVWPVSAAAKEPNKYAIWSVRVGNLTAVGLVGMAFTGWLQYAQTQALYKIPFTNDKEVKQAAVKAAIDNAAGAWLFQEQVDLAKLGATVITRDNADSVRILSEKLLHSTAEPQVIQPLLLSLLYLQDTTALQFHMARFCNAFPASFLRWYRAPAVHALVVTAGVQAENCSRSGDPLLAPHSPDLKTP